MQVCIHVHAYKCTCVCVCVCVAGMNVCTYTPMLTHTHISMHAYVHANMNHMHARVYIHACMHTCVHELMQPCLCMYDKYISIHVCTCMRRYIHAYILTAKYKHIHTYIQTYIHTWVCTHTYKCIRTYMRSYLQFAYSQNIPEPILVVRNQVLDFLVVNLYVRHFDHELGFFRSFADKIKHVGYDAWHQTSARFHIEIAAHGMRLSWPCLSVRENRSIEAIHEIHDNLVSDQLEHVFLCGWWAQSNVKVERLPAMQLYWLPAEHGDAGFRNSARDASCKSAVKMSHFCLFGGVFIAHHVYTLVGSRGLCKLSSFCGNGFLDSVCRIEAEKVVLECCPGAERCKPRSVET